MAYQKTAKDKAWDAQRAKLRAEAAMWQDRYNVENARCESLMRKNLILANRVHELEEAITKLTDGKMTPDEAVAQEQVMAHAFDEAYEDAMRELHSRGTLKAAQTMAKVIYQVRLDCHRYFYKKVDLRKEM